ncbi:MAG TPA: trypsin-like peptidase domain-containing protein [Steroidobacteraceae bacterium]|nr:trypsin-like peptidase domain-containing protein [Steroidobacteraceae bacterium]
MSDRHAAAPSRTHRTRIAAGLLAALAATAVFAQATPPAELNPQPAGPIATPPAGAPPAAAAALPPKGATELLDERPEWARTLQRIADGVVTIQVDQTRAFDTEWNATAQATGFVVDAKRGLILTNRHVVTPGPVTAQAVFQNREEVQLYPVYRDPVHDFGIYRYDPAKLKFAKPQEIALAPEAAKVGTEIRVVGNDAGEQLSILAGTLARLDRDAPAYGVGKYNDFNTFYYQAASSTSGGSSGSPVIDVKGRAVALNAGGSSQAASSFYLPLDRVVRALKLLQDGKPVPRGTLQVVFEYTPYDELERLGLKGDTEAAVRRSFPKQVGMLVVKEVQPGSPSEGVLEPGDVLVRIDGRYVTEFLALDALLDDSVGKTVRIEVQRGGTVLDRELPVGDLHAITPDEYLEFGDAVVHRLSYQQARHFNVPIRGVYVANPGYVFGSAGVPRGAVLTAFNGKSVKDLDDFEKALADLAQGDRATLRFFTLEDPRNSQVRSVRIDRQWFPARRCKRDDALGWWPCRALAPGPAPGTPEPASTTFAASGDPRADKLAPSLVMINFDMPYSVSGVTERSYRGTGVIVDAERGLVVTDRNTVPVAMGDVRLTFAGTIEVPGKVEYVHPLHNLAVVSYDPKLIGSTPVRAARFTTRELASGDPVWVVGLRADQRLAALESRVAAVDAAQFPLSHTLAFRESNLEVVSLVNGPADFDGVITDKRGEVRALWSSFAFDNGRELQQQNLGTPAEVVTEMVELAKTGRVLRSLEAELQVVPLSLARKFGLDDAWIKRMEVHSPARRQALGIGRLVAGTPAAALLQTGDLLLAIDGTLVNRFREVERAVQKPSVRLTVWRNGAELNLDVATAALAGHDIDRIVLWAGATLQAPHRALAAQRGVAPTGVFVAFFLYGSPATRYGLWAGRRIIEVDGRPTPDLDAFLAAVSGKADRASLRLKTATWNNSVEVSTLKLDQHYWPAYELKRGPSGWERHSLE